MANEIKGLAPQSQTYAAWVSANPVLGISGYGQIVVATGSEYGDIMVWGAGQTFNTAFADGQWFQGIGAQSITSGRKYIDELPEWKELDSVGWWTIYEGASIAGYNTFSTILQVWTYGVGNGGSTTLLFNHSETTLSLTDRAQFKILGASYENTTRVSFRVCARTGSYAAGIKIQIYNPIVGTQVKTQINTNASRHAPGVVKVVPYLDNGTITLPDGSTTADTYLEAGTVLPSLSTSTFRDNRITAYANSTTALHITLLWDDIPKQNAVTITFPSGFTFRQSGGTAIYTVTAADTVTVDTVKNRTVTGIITTTGLTANVSGAAVGANVSATLS